MVGHDLGATLVTELVTQRLQFLANNRHQPVRITEDLQQPVTIEADEGQLLQAPLDVDLAARFGGQQGARQSAASAVAGFAFLLFAVVGVEILV